MNTKIAFRSFLAMVKARTMEFVRDRGTFFWNLIFPFLLVFGFAFAFSGGNNSIFSVGTLGPMPEEYFLSDIDGIEFIDYDEKETSMEDALEKLREHSVDMLIDFDSAQYYLNSEAGSTEILRNLMIAGGTGGVSGANIESFTEASVSGEAIRYVDWLVPGVIGMNMMFSCLFGVGFVLVRYRKNGVLKRMKATPVSALNFVSAQAASRLIIVVLTSIVVFIGTNIFLKFVMKGNWLNLLLLTTLAILCMISLGLVFASRIKSEELAGGLLNLITMPMLILSGVFFSLENAPAFVGKIAKILPLTHFVDGAREIMLNGAGLLQILPNLVYLGGLTIGFLLLSAFLFKWE